MSAIKSDPRDIICFTNNTVRIPDVLRLLKKGDKIPSGKIHRVWRILSKHEGDKRITWNSMSISEIAGAEELFNQLKAEGMEGFCVGVDGERSSTRMDVFDPYAEEVIFVPMGAAVAG